MRACHCVIWHYLMWFWSRPLRRFHLRRTSCVPLNIWKTILQTAPHHKVRQRHCLKPLKKQTKYLQNNWQLLFIRLWDLLLSRPDKSILKFWFRYALKIWLRSLMKPLYLLQKRARPMDGHWQEPHRMHLQCAKLHQDYTPIWIHQDTPT